MQTERNTKKNPVFLLISALCDNFRTIVLLIANVALGAIFFHSSLCSPIYFPLLSVSSGDSFGTHLRLTWDLHRTYFIISLHIKMATSRTHPERIPNIKNVISIIKNRGRSCAYISLTPYLYIIPRFFVAVIHGVEV